MAIIRDYNEVDILYTLMSYVNISSSNDMYYTIAYTILNNLEKIPDISINNLAELCYTSPATLSRFTKDIGCKSFANFKQEIAIALNNASTEVDLNTTDLVSAKDHPELLVRKIYQETIDSLKLGLDSVDIHDIDIICKKIKDAKKVHLIGYQFNRIVLNDFQMKLIKLKKFMFSFVHSGEEIQGLDTIDEDTLVIILTVRARPQLLDELVNSAALNNPKIMMITMNQTYNNEHLDYIYRLKGFDSAYTQSAMMGSIDFLTLLNTIYVRYAMLYGNEK